MQQSRWATWWAAENYWLPDETIGKAEAQRYAEVALALDPAEPWARMMLGLSLGTDATGPQFNRALKEFEAAIHINPSFALAQQHDGWVLVNAGRFETAEQETRTALRLSLKDSFASLYELVRRLTLLTNRQYEEAYAHLQRALVAFPEIPQHHTLLICCCGYRAEGGSDDAHVAQESLARCSPSDSQSRSRAASKLSLHRHLD